MVSRSARAAALVSSAYLFAGAAAQLAALRAAGLNGTPPPHAGTFKQLINTLTENWIWLVGTGVSLAIVLVGGMMMFGDIRAPERVFRIAGGIIIILVVSPAVLA